MNIFKELGILYKEIDDYYAHKELEAKIKIWNRKENEFKRKRMLNDHAYYLFMFTRLEDHVRRQSSRLIKRKQISLANWKQKRVWSLLPKEKNSDKINFLNRVALLVDKGGHYYKKIKDYYLLRNKLGHGGLSNSPISILKVVKDFELLSNILKAR